MFMYILFSVTHLVTSAENGCCPRTLKYLYAVAAAKWIVSFDCKYITICVYIQCIYSIMYINVLRILQIVQGGKVSQLQN